MNSVIGGAIAVLVLSLLLSIVVTPILLHRYRKSVENLQRESLGENADSTLSSVDTCSRKPVNASILLLEKINREYPTGLKQHRLINRMMWRKATAYLLLVVDKSTDHQYLDSQLKNLWENIDQSSPNVDNSTNVELFEYKQTFTGRRLKVLEHELLASMEGVKY